MGPNIGEEREGVGEPRQAGGAATGSGRGFSSGCCYYYFLD